MSEHFNTPEQIPPWRPEDGPEPRVRCRPPGDQATLYIDVGAGTYAPVVARLGHADGRTEYQVAFQADRGRRTVHQASWRPRPGLRVTTPCTQTDLVQGLLDTAETAI
ncbi:hypothetical protein [Streptomyces sp. Ac-502]|uniref:hypothetical protein n=1 Tax=Streptomyces sp. Ac-502 TaxID=3342801 RepID=UPI003862314A